MSRLPFLCPPAYMGHASGYQYDPEHANIDRVVGLFLGAFCWLDMGAACETRTWRMLEWRTNHRLWEGGGSRQSRGEHTTCYLRETQAAKQLL